MYGEFVGDFDFAPPKWGCSDIIFSPPVGPVCALLLVANCLRAKTLPTQKINTITTLMEPTVSVRALTRTQNERYVQMVLGLCMTRYSTGSRRHRCIQHNPCVSRVRNASCRFAASARTGSISGYATQIPVRVQMLSSTPLMHTSRNQYAHNHKSSCMRTRVGVVCVIQWLCDWQTGMRALFDSAPRAAGGTGNRRCTCGRGACSRLPV